MKSIASAVALCAAGVIGIIPGAAGADECEAWCETGEIVAEVDYLSCGAGVATVHIYGYPDATDIDSEISMTVYDPRGNVVGRASNFSQGEVCEVVCEFTPHRRGVYYAEVVAVGYAYTPDGPCSCVIEDTASLEAWCPGIPIVQCYPH